MSASPLTTSLRQVESGFAATHVIFTPEFSQAFLSSGSTQTLGTKNYNNEFNIKQFLRFIR